MLQGLFKGLKDLIYPNSCLICKNIIPAVEKRQLICSGCWERIEKNPPPFCSGCGRHLDEQAIKNNACPGCAKSAANFYFDRAFSPCAYTGSIKKLIHEFKYSGRDYLGKYLAEPLCGFIRDYQLPIEYLDYIIPVPLHPSRKREREFNQAQLLGEEIGREFGIKVSSDALVRVKATKTQTELAFQERWQNLEGSFSVIKPDLIKGSNLLLIDDVLTTGATASQAAKCLKDSGAKKVILLTLAS